MNTVEEKLAKVGMRTAVAQLQEKKATAKKMLIAYEHYRFVRQENIDAFNRKLKEESYKETRDAYQYKFLNFISLESYTEIPPLHVLESIEQAMEKGCFDTFEVAKIQDVVQVKDPIVFGRIKGCPDRFFIDQWDDDVRITDLLKEGEG